MKALMGWQTDRASYLNQSNQQSKIRKLLTPDCSFLVVPIVKFGRCSFGRSDAANQTIQS